MIDWICARLDHPRQWRQRETSPMTFQCYWSCLCGEYLTPPPHSPLPRVRQSWLVRLLAGLTETHA